MVYRYKPEDGSLLFKFNAEGSRIANGKVYDLSRWGNHATIINGVSLKPSPSGKPMLYFDGVNQCIRVPGNSKLDSVNFTISVWLNNLDSIATQGGIIGTTGFSSFRGIGVYWDGNDNISMWAGDGFTREGLALCPRKPGFHHYIFSKNGRVISTMVDGIPRNPLSFPTISAPERTGFDWYIGQSISASYNFHGPVNDVRFYNRPLSRSEGSRIYNETRRYYGK